MSLGYALGSRFRHGCGAVCGKVPATVCAKNVVAYPHPVLTCFLPGTRVTLITVSVTDRLRRLCRLT